MNHAARLEIRCLQLRDVDAIEALAARSPAADDSHEAENLAQKLEQFQRWYGLLKVLRLLPQPRHHLDFYVAEQAGDLRGAIQVSPFNTARSTWRVDRVLTDSREAGREVVLGMLDVGSQLLRHCFESIWEARTWILEVDIHDKSTLALYRQNGFQPLAQLTYWAIAPEKLAELAQHEPRLPNLLPVGNADAQLLYQLDTVSMPPLLRQVFDRHTDDFRTPPLQSAWEQAQRLLRRPNVMSAYVFEPQRKAAIGYFKLHLAESTDGPPHQAELTVHPAYTWLYPELLAQMARLTQATGDRPLQVLSADYQPEREEYCEQIGATRERHTLLMSRSVWHKLREARPLEGLQLSDVLQGLQPARTPVPTRLSLWQRPGRHAREPERRRSEQSPE
ncbi:MAG: GNAT family N-acetyltransferase [Spirulinaceae cyanobacterium RM2_2_10]|nr:GNAT family N-acetyltransferase [Spirulinaceae cyanobacterium SM2_1_0]NJO20960.1 GNAT family N-acetyltransferase [Spirulinaceae cyanobacterium RM2_2_10]